MLPNIFPVMIYQDTDAAIAWLTGALGFEQRLVVPGADGRIQHAELGLGAGGVMLAALKDGAELSRPREELEVYVSIEDVDAHCARARAAGAEIVREPFDTDYGSRDYAVRDPEGHVWYFGTYLPGES